MEGKRVEGVSPLAMLCIGEACRSKECVQIWQRQTHTLRRLPSLLAEPLLHSLLRTRLLTAPLLELFKETVHEVNFSGEAVVDSEWISYLGSFTYLRALRLAECREVSNSALSKIVGLKHLEELDLNYCSKVSNEAMKHIVSLGTLKKMRICQTHVGKVGLLHLSSLKHLSHLDLGGLPVTDMVISSLLSLHRLEHLDLWGSEVSNEGIYQLQAFPHLQYLNVAWTSVTKVPPLHSLKYLNMSKCVVDSVFEGWEESTGSNLSASPLQELHLSGSVIPQPWELFRGNGMKDISVLDLSAATLSDYSVFGELSKIERLNLSGPSVPNSVMESIAGIGQNLGQLDLSGSQVNSEGIKAIVGSVPNLEHLSLSGTRVDDSVFGLFPAMPSLQSLDLSHTSLNGGNDSLSSLKTLRRLRVLNMQNTLVSNESCQHLGNLDQLSYLYLRGNFLSDEALQYLSAMPNLEFLSIQSAMLTDEGLLGFAPPPLLRKLDISDCWLLTEAGLRKFGRLHSCIFIKHELLLMTDKKAGGCDGFDTTDLKKKVETNASLSEVLPFLDSLTTKLSLQQRSEKRGGGSSHAAINKHVLDDSLVLIDERIKYSFAELSRIREHAASNRQVTLPGLDALSINIV